jgi:hypothetical protein
MLDIAVAYNRYRFLGNEFLTWLWFLIENDAESLQKIDADFLELTVGNRMVLENRLANGIETITIKGDAAGLEEGLLALRKGALVVDINLVYKNASLQWQFSVKGENLSLSALKLPETAPIETSDDIEGLVLERIYLYEKPFILIDALYQRFIKIRLSEQWQKKTMTDMRKWMLADK